MTLEGSCHCGGAGWTLEGDPGSITICNCTLSRRYGALWAYDFEGERIALDSLGMSWLIHDVSTASLRRVIAVTSR